MINSRIDWDSYGLLLAYVGSLRSRDPFTKVGACAMDKNHRILGVAYNGEASGIELPFDLEDRERKNEYFIHAESNILSLTKRGECDTLYLTISPCGPCSKLIVAHDIRRVVYIEEYWRENNFKKIFDMYKVEYEEYGKEKFEGLIKTL